MNIKILNTLMARVTNKVLEGKTLKEAGAIVIDGELRTTVIYKDNV